MINKAKATGFHIKYDFCVGERFEDMCVRLRTAYNRVNRKKRKLHILTPQEEIYYTQESRKISVLNSNFPYDTEEDFEIGMAAMKEEYLRLKAIEEELENLIPSHITAEDKPFFWIK